MSESLKSCPFCGGGNAEMVCSGGYWYVVCGGWNVKGCGASTAHAGYGNAEAATTAWNRRAAQESTP